MVAPGGLSPPPRLQARTPAQPNASAMPVLPLLGASAQLAFVIAAILVMRLLGALAQLASCHHVTKYVQARLPPLTQSDMCCLLVEKVTMV